MPDELTEAQQEATPQRVRVWEAAFLRVLRMTGIVKTATEAAQIDRATVYRARERYPEFAAKWSEAMEEAADNLEIEATRRAIQGVQRPIYQKGELVGHELVYSDRLLEILLKASRPEKYRERLSVLTEDALDAEIRRLRAELAQNDPDGSELREAQARETGGTPEAQAPAG